MMPPVSNEAEARRTEILRHRALVARWLLTCPTIAAVRRWRCVRHRKVTPERRKARYAFTDAHELRARQPRCPGLFGVPFSTVFLLHLILVRLSAYSLVGLAVSIDGRCVQERLSGAVPERLGGGALVSDSTISPAYIVGGQLLWRRRELGYVASMGLLFQSSMLFTGLIGFLVLQPFLASSTARPQLAGLVGDSSTMRAPGSEGRARWCAARIPDLGREALCSTVARPVHVGASVLSGGRPAPLGARNQCALWPGPRRLLAAWC